MKNFFRRKKKNPKKKGVVRRRRGVNNNNNSTPNYFGRSISEFRKFPMPVLQIIEYLESKHMELMIGIYRKPGKLDECEKLKRVYEDSVEGPVNLNSFQNIYSIGHTLKMYFKMLPEPITTFEEYEGFMNVLINFNDKNVVVERIREIVHKKLPRVNAMVLERVMKHLKIIADSSNINKMTGTNLGIVWGPVLFRARNFSMVELLKDVTKISGVTEFMILNYLEIFGADFRVFNSSSSMSNNNNSSSVTTRKVLVSSQPINMNHLDGDVRVLFEIFEYLESNDGLIGTPGIYRRAGNINRSKNLLQSLRSGKSILLSQFNVLTLCTVVKMYIREFPDCVTKSDTEYDNFLTIGKDLKDEREQILAIRKLLIRLPKRNRQILKRLFYHLSKCVELKSKNLMSVENFSIVFCPNLFRTKNLNNPLEMITNSNHFYKVSNVMITKYQEIFEERGDLRRNGNTNKVNEESMMKKEKKEQQLIMEKKKELLRKEEELKEKERELNEKENAYKKEEDLSQFLKRIKLEHLIEKFENVCMEDLEFMEENDLIEYVPKAFQRKRLLIEIQKRFNGDGEDNMLVC